MEIDSVTQTAYYSAAFLSAILSIAFLYQKFKNSLPISLFIAGLFQTGWLYCAATQDFYSATSLSILYQSETLRHAFWLFAITRTTERLCTQCTPLVYKLFIYTTIGVALAATLTTALIELNAATLTKLLFWQGIVLSVLGLLAVEQLYRNNTNYRFIKLMCIIMSVIYVFDAYIFTQNLLLNELNAELWQARAAIMIVATAVMIIGLLTLVQTSNDAVKLTLSRPAIFYTTSLTIAGIFLTTLSFAGYYVQIYGGNWGTVIYTLMLASSLFIICALVISKEKREKLTVIINKHLFNYKYDYRTEWINLINKLSKDGGDTPANRTIKIAAELFRCNGGALWLKRNNNFNLSKQINANFNINDSQVKDTSDFCQALQNEWVFAPRSMRGDLSLHNEVLPNWVRKNESARLVFPLLTEKNLIGFMILNSDDENPLLNWEDLDLIKTVARQFASYLTRHEQEEQLAEVRQFDAFNKLSAFVMHDLKNLIAQQSLVVKNAEKHKDNPAFIEDAISTIHNSVERMNNLLRKLQHNEPVSAKTLSLKEVFIEAVRRCQKTTPNPTLRPVDPNIKVKADFDSLTMVFTHIIHNAQDATQTSGFIDITANQVENSVTITIEDNGSGMDSDFIQNKLFKPFETTKSGKGMGVGVYQAQEYITSLGGSINVESSPGLGTTFTLSIPTI